MLTAGEPHFWWSRVKDTWGLDGALTRLAPPLDANTVLITPYRSFRPDGYAGRTISPYEAHARKRPRQRQRLPPNDTQRGSRFWRRLVKTARAFTLESQTLARCRRMARRGYDDARDGRGLLLRPGGSPQRRLRLPLALLANGHL